MKVIKELAMLLLIYFISLSDADEPKHYRRRSLLDKDHKSLKIRHRNEIELLKNEMAQLKKDMQARCSPHPIRHGSITEERNSKMTMEWAQKAMGELRMQMKEVSNKVDSSAMLQQLQFLHNNMNRIVTENGYYMNVARTLDARVDKMDNLVQRLRYDKKNIENMIGELRLQLSSISKQVKHKIMELEEEAGGLSNDVEPVPAARHKHRHSKMVHAQLLRLSQAQDQLEAGHQSVQVQLLGHQRRLEHLEEPNWDLVSAKLDYLDIQVKSFNERLGNSTPAASDVEKMHASILELREDLEAVENKMDKTIPEFRKEISKLDVDQAQMNAHFSYVKQDQESLRQSVKAIAVSMSNTQDRTVLNREEIKKISDVMNGLTMQSKRHYYRLNDHILKSEANAIAPETNLTEIISLPELMGEVKDLQPVEHEYQDLIAQLPKDCTNLTEPAGSYIIRPGHETVNAWCVNGSTLVQRRFNGSVEFNRKFAEYVAGFGDVSTEYWIGLETMHHLTSDNCSSMQIDMTDIYGAAWYAQYDRFAVGDAGSGYVLNVSGYNGNASDAFEYQNHMEFSAIDRDRDISNTNCAANYEGGWWFSHCQHVNINGKYILGLTWFDSTRNEWIAVATTEMRVFRRAGCV